MNQDNHIISQPTSPLKAKLLAWEADPVGKCGTCTFALGFDNELDKYTKDTCVRCSSLGRAIRADNHNWEGYKYQRQVETQGWFRLIRIEYEGRFNCPCWEAK